MIKSDMLDYIAKSKNLLNTRTWYLEDETEELFDNLIGKWKRDKNISLIEERAKVGVYDDAATKSQPCSTTNEEPDGIVW